MHGLRRCVLPRPAEWGLANTALPTHQTNSPVLAGSFSHHLNVSEQTVPALRGQLSTRADGVTTTASFRTRICARMGLGVVGGRCRHRRRSGMAPVGPAHRKWSLLALRGAGITAGADVSGGGQKVRHHPQPARSRFRSSAKALIGNAAIALMCGLRLQRLTSGKRLDPCYHSLPRGEGRIQHP